MIKRAIEAAVAVIDIVRERDTARDQLEGAQRELSRLRNLHQDEQQFSHLMYRFLQGAAHGTYDVETSSQIQNLLYRYPQSGNPSFLVQMDALAPCIGARRRELEAEAEAEAAKKKK